MMNFFNKKDDEYLSKKEVKELLKNEIFFKATNEIANSDIGKKMPRPLIDALGEMQKK